MQSRAIATREAVLSAGARVFERQGYAAATIAEILSEAGVTKGAMYHHFESKEALARAIIAEQSNWRQDHVDPSLSAFQRIVDLSYSFAEALQNDALVRASIRLTLEQNTFEGAQLIGGPIGDPYRDWLTAVQALLEDCVRSKALTVDAKSAAFLIVSAVTGAQLVSEALTGRADLRERLREIWEILAPALVTKATLRRTDLRGSGRAG